MEKSVTSADFFSGLMTLHVPRLKCPGQPIKECEERVLRKCRLRGRTFIHFFNSIKKLINPSIVIVKDCVRAVSCPERSCLQNFVGVIAVAFGYIDGEVGSIQPQVKAPTSWFFSIP